MSIFSDHKAGCIDDDTFNAECARMNREDRADRELLPFEPVKHYCEECPHFKTGLTFPSEICDIYGNTGVSRDTPRYNLVIKKDRARYGYTHLCVKDIEHIKEVNPYDEICDDMEEMIYDTETVTGNN